MCGNVDPVNGEAKRRGRSNEVYVTALSNRFISFQEARTIAENEASARMILSRQAKKGSLLRVRGGLYAAVPPEHRGEPFEVNRYLLFDRYMGSGGALAFHSALELHGVAQSRFSTVFYLAAERARQFTFQGIVYRPVWAHEVFGRTTVLTDGLPIHVTDKERTFLDCIRRLDLCGGLEEYLKSVESFTLISPGRLLDYLGKFGEASLWQRAGLILSGMRDRIKVDDELLETMRSKVSRNHYYLVPSKIGGGQRLVKEWNVLIPSGLEEMVRPV